MWQVLPMKPLQAACQAMICGGVGLVWAGHGGMRRWSRQSCMRVRCRSPASSRTTSALCLLYTSPSPRD
eukprot:10743629-Alexandrium_andersonii.AAC.1